jgi:hypothetical protein
MRAMSAPRQVHSAIDSDFVVPKRTVVSGMAGGAFVLLSLSAGLGALFFDAGMACDDTCAGTQPPPGADWTQYSDAAQWSQIGLLAATSMALALATTLLVLFRRRRAAGMLIALFTAASVPLAALVDHAHPGGFSWVWLLASALGVLTVLAARPR